MKLARIRIDQFQQFRTPLEITDLAPGLNLFAGPNESGKSTLVRAIRAAFFERHKTGTLDHLRPWGDTSAAPEVSLEFDWQGSRWTLHKRFLQRKRCDLECGSQRYSGDDADNRLAELLGYEFPGRGASKAEHWGIPGLLWVEQGAVQDMREPVSHAGDHLQSALGDTLDDAMGEALGSVASSRGDALIARVEKERNALLTARTGNPTGEFKQARQACDELAATLGELDARVAEYCERVDRLGELERARRESDAERPWEAYQTRAEHSRQALRAVEEQQRLQEQESHELRGCQRNADLWRQQLQDMEGQAQQLQKRGQDKARLEQQLTQLQACSAGIKRRVEAATAAYGQAEATLDAARRQAHRQTLQAEQERIHKQYARLRSALDDARRLGHRLQQLREQHQLASLDSRELGRLQGLERELQTLGIREQALATRLAYRLEDGQRLMLGERQLSGSGEAKLLASAELRIPGVGSLTVTPGGQDVKDLTRRQELLLAERDALLQTLRVASLAEGEQRARQADALARDMQQERARLKGLAPEGLDALESEQRLTEQRQTQLADELAQLPDAPEAGARQSEAQAKSLLSESHAELKAAEADEQDHRRELGLAQQALTTANTEWQGLHAELDDPARRDRQQQAQDELTGLQAKSERLQASMEQRQRDIDAAHPEVLASDIERYTRTANSLYQQAQQRERNIHTLQVQLEAHGADGLEEARENARQDYQRMARRRDELDGQAGALDLLLSLLREQRQAVTRRLQAPLQKHLNHYLRLLFPGAELTVDDALRPETLVREDETRGELEALSFGAREQMGLITRLAYADLLKEAGRPTLVILDDALVHCDRARREQMKRMLFDAATRHQILLFTCHPENWHDLGVVPREMTTLKLAADPAPTG